MQHYWTGLFTKAQTLEYLAALDCGHEPLPPVNRSLWICPPGRDASASCITKTRQKGTDGRLLYRLDLYRAAAPANPEV
jgi:hypothetical protein